MTYRERCERVAEALGLETDGLELLHGNRAGDEAGFRAVPVRSSSVGIWAAVIPHDTMERVEDLLADKIELDRRLLVQSLTAPVEELNDGDCPLCRGSGGNVDANARCPACRATPGRKA